MDSEFWRQQLQHTYLSGGVDDAHLLVLDQIHPGVEQLILQC